MTPEQELTNLIAAMEPQQAMLAMLRIMFVQTAEIRAAVDQIVPVLGAIAGRTGLSGKQLRDLLDRADNSYSVNLDRDSE